jgi:pyroglutamyl-peptidase
MAVDDIVRGIEIIIAVSAMRTKDIHTAEGRIS